MYINGLQHIGIPTEKFRQTAAFYQKLGFELINSEDNQGAKVGFFELNGLVIEVWEEQSPNKVGAIHHIAFDTSDIEGAFHWIKEMGFEMIDEKIMTLSFWERGIRYFNFYGPNKEIIEICQKD